MLKVIMQNVIMLSVILLSVIMANVIMLNGILPNAYFLLLVAIKSFLTFLELSHLGFSHGAKLTTYEVITLQ
jgi:hypothetical protein